MCKQSFLTVGVLFISGSFIKYSVMHRTVNGGWQLEVAKFAHKCDKISARIMAPALCVPKEYPGRFLICIEHIHTIKIFKHVWKRFVRILGRRLICVNNGLAGLALGRTLVKYKTFTENHLSTPFLDWIGFLNIHYKAFFGVLLIILFSKNIQSVFY